MIARKLRGDSDYDNMRSSNEEMMETPIGENGAELDNSEAINVASKTAVDAVHSKDVKAFKNSIKEIILLCLEEQEQEGDEY